MNVPNSLTLSRLVSAFAMMILLVVIFPFSKSLALVVFALGGYHRLSRRTPRPHRLRHHRIRCLDGSRDG